MMVTIRILAAAWLISVTGCAENVYRVELKPDGDRIHRTLSIVLGAQPATAVDPEMDPDVQAEPNGSQIQTHTDASAAINRADAVDPESEPADEMLRIGKLYAATRQVVDGSDRPSLPKHVDDATAFDGWFGRQMPADVGGAGTYDRFETSLGSVSIYSERFRGQDNIDQLLVDRADSINAIIELTMDWIDFEVRDVDQAKRLKDFVDGQLRHDLSNVTHYLWLASTAEDEKTSHSHLFRAGQYLAERDYFAISDLPVMVRQVSGGQPNVVARMIRKSIQRRIQRIDSSPPPAALSRLDDLPAVEKSLRTFLRGTDHFQSIVARYRNEGKPVTDDSPDPMEVLSEPVFRIAMPFLASSPDRIEVTLHTPQAPLATNGNWDAESSTVRWSSRLQSLTLPTYTFAAWCQPNDEAQIKHFGRVWLTDESLADYARWYHGLTDDERSEWDGMITSLEPGDELSRTLASFAFSESPKLAEEVTAGWIKSLSAP
ncbi:hypothetical protein [Rubripirellula lacrimiformis]|nr:hypothetical protein [Rubripirellula lacrimiformis]